MLGIRCDEPILTFARACCQVSYSFLVFRAYTVIEDLHA